MHLLALDTALDRCSVALRACDGTVTALSEPMSRGHAERLAPMIAAVMQTAGLGFAAINRVAVTTGPGSFTGVRVALSTARGLGMALAVPVIGIGTLAVLAAAARMRHPGHPVEAALSTRDGLVIVQRFAADGTPDDPVPLLAPPDARVQTLPDDAVLIGSGTARLAEARAAAGLPALACDPADGVDPAVLATLAAAAVPTGRPPEPVYVRPPDAKVSSRPGLIRA